MCVGECEHNTLSSLRCHTIILDGSHTIVRLCICHVHGLGQSSSAHTIRSIRTLVRRHFSRTLSAHRSLYTEISIFTPGHYHFVDYDIVTFNTAEIVTICQNNIDIYCVWTCRYPRNTRRRRCMPCEGGVRYYYLYRIKICKKRREPNAVPAIFVTRNIFGIPRMYVYTRTLVLYRFAN